MGLLTGLIFLPLFGAGAIGISSRWPGWPRRLALVFSLAVFALSLVLWVRFDATVETYQFVESYPWIPSFGISYLVGIDGVSLSLVLLTTFLIPLSVLAGWEAVQEKVSVYYALLLALESMLIGVFLALDVFLFYVLWEAVLFPMFFLIGVWGGRRRVGGVGAAIKFFLFNMGGSIFLLVGILVCYQLHNVQTGAPSFDVRTWLGLVMTGELQRWLFLAFFVGCAVKIPLFPLHAWLPDAHGEAPTAGSVILAGIVLKLGVYGLLRFGIPLFPEGARTFAPTILTLAVVGILYGGLVAMVQPDIRRLLAYSSVCQLGFVVLGLFSFTVLGLEGAVYQMLSHGISTGALFLLAGMLYERRQTYAIDDLGGLRKSMPWFAGLFLIVMLSSMGLPGLNGFVGQFLILLGAFQTARPFAVAAGFGVILVAVYLLSMYKRVMLGEIRNPANAALADVNRREGAILLPIVLLIFWMGVAPGGFLRALAGTAERIIPVAPVGVLEE
jgi:NADH-quinone oxidoreductase subunit M